MKKKDPKYWEKKQRKIFVILFEKTSTFFVNDTTQESNWKFYDEHYRQRHSVTKEQFELYKTENELPPMYLLDTIDGTISDTFTRKVEWSKYFTDHGYTGLVGGKMSEAVEDFDPENSEFYLSIKDIPLVEICGPDKNLARDFRNSSKNKRTENSFLSPEICRVPVYMKKDEYDKYKKLAQDYGVSLTQYINECLRLGGPYNVDISFLEEYTRAINKCYSLFSGMLATYLLSGEYYPADIIEMEKIAKQINNSNKKVQNKIIYLCRVLREMRYGEQLNKDPLE